MILASLKPYYYYLIGEKKKNIEVRKSALKDLPQDIVFYMSKDEKSFAKIPKEFQERYRKHFGKVGMRVICDKVDEYKYDYGCDYYVGDGVDIDDDTLLETAISRKDINIYAKGKTLYGWHISDLKIYDKPKKLSEFYRPCSYSGICYSCKRFRPYGTPNDSPNDFCDGTISRPPQSYMRVEELGE